MKLLNHLLPYRSQATPARTPGAQAGQSLLELTLVLPVLLLLMAGLVDLGRVFQVYTAIVNATREGASYAALHPADTSGIRDAVVQESAGSSIDLSQGTIMIETPDGTSPGQPITVSLTYQFPLITELVVRAQSIPIKASTTMTIE